MVNPALGFRYATFLFMRCLLKSAITLNASSSTISSSSAATTVWQHPDDHSGVERSDAGVIDGSYPDVVEVPRMKSVDGNL